MSKTGRGFVSAADVVIGYLEKLKPVDGEAETERETRVDGQKFNGEISGFTVTPSPPRLVMLPMTAGT